MAVTVPTHDDLQANWTLSIQNKTLEAGDLTSMELFLWYTHLYVTPVLIVVGLVGNLLSFAVFMGTHLRQLSSTFYLAGLSIADTAFLIQLFISWLGYVRIFIFHTEGFCQTFVYLSYVCGFLSVWFVVGFTVERYIAMCYPFRRQDMCTVSRAKAVVFSLTCFALAAYSFGAWTSGIVTRGAREECGCLPEYCHLVFILNNVDTVVTLIVPLLTIFTMNMRIAHKISRFCKRHNNMGVLQNGRQLSGRYRARDRWHPNVQTSNNSPRTIHFQVKVTKLLLIVSSSFLILNTPSHAIRIYIFFARLLSPSFATSRRLVPWQQAFTMLFYCNFVINFFLYSLCGKNFRSALCRLLMRARRRNGGAVRRSRYGTVVQMTERGAQAALITEVLSSHVKDF